MRERKQHVISLVAVPLVLIMLLPACSLTRWGPGDTYSLPLPSTQNPPIYPNAQDVSISTNSVEKRITFETSAESAKVLDYYKSLLLKEGWIFVPGDDPPNWLSFEYGNGPFYRFGVEVDNGSSGHTNVVLIIQTFLGE